MHMGEGPSNPLQAEAVRDPWILVNILIVVVVDELVPERLAEDNPDNCHKENTDNACDDELRCQREKGTAQLRTFDLFVLPNLAFEEIRMQRFE